MSRTYKKKWRGERWNEPRVSKEIRPPGNSAYLVHIIASNGHHPNRTRAWWWVYWHLIVYIIRIYGTCLVSTHCCSSSAIFLIMYFLLRSGVLCVSAYSYILSSEIFYYFFVVGIYFRSYVWYVLLLCVRIVYMLMSFFGSLGPGRQNRKQVIFRTRVVFRPLPSTPTTAAYCCSYVVCEYYSSTPNSAAAAVLPIIVIVVICCFKICLYFRVDAEEWMPKPKFRVQYTSKYDKNSHSYVWHIHLVLFCSAVRIHFVLLLFLQ